MTRTAEITVKRKLPTRKDAFVFRGKTALSQMRRAVSDVFDRTLTRHPRFEQSRRRTRDRAYHERRSGRNPILKNEC